MRGPFSLASHEVALNRETSALVHDRRERWGLSYHVIPGDKTRDFAPIVAQLTGT